MKAIDWDQAYGEIERIENEKRVKQLELIQAQEREKAKEQFEKMQKEEMEKSEKIKQ